RTLYVRLEALQEVLSDRSYIFGRIILTEVRPKYSAIIRHFAKVRVVIKREVTGLVDHAERHKQVAMPLGQCGRTPRPKLIIDHSAVKLVKCVAARMRNGFDKRIVNKYSKCGARRQVLIDNAYALPHCAKYYFVD